MATEGISASNNVNKPDIKSKTIYFGVYIPNDNPNGQPNIFEDKEAALKVAKKHKKSRFKAFNFYHEAADFSLNGAECPNNNGAIEGVETDKKETSATIGEKASPFKTPRPQELVEFRSVIENGNLAYIQEMIDYNPRYLVSSGDTPSILQEGARLNAVHVAAREKNAAVVELILNTINNPEFIKKLYGDDNHENAEQRCKMLLDLYLNTPNKGANDTPLHIASKWGADKVVEILLSYPECDKTKRNKFNKFAEDVICERVEGKAPESVKKKIQQLLYDNYYVPVFRSEDNSLPPIVGQPFSPTSPPVLNKDPLSPRLEIHAYAGPMEKKEADSFRKVWKTPPRSLNFNSPNGKKSPGDLTALRLKDPEKGLERIGKKLANNYNVCWKEYWEFLDCFVDIASDEGLNILEQHLQRKKKDLQDAFEVFSPLVQKSDTVVSPITSLCNAFSACRIEEASPVLLHEGMNPLDYERICRPLVYVDKACQVFANRILANVFNIFNCNECQYEHIAKHLETDIKLLELLMNSYMDDERFAKWVNFQKVHARLAHIVAKKLHDSNKDYNSSFFVHKLEGILESIVKRSDDFSSDDEGPNCKETCCKPTIYRKQVVCLLSRIKSCLESSQNCIELDEEHLSVNAWDIFDVCSCIFHPRKPKKGNLSRNSSFKNSSNRFHRYDLQNVSKKLCFGDELPNDSQAIGTNGDLGLNFSDSSRSDTDDEFYTPLSSPKIWSENSSDSEDLFSDAEPPKLEVFLEGAHPTKTDYAVYNALQYAECNINKDKFPVVYKWHHSISLYSSSERESWPNSHKQESPEPTLQSPKSYPPPKPTWLRITGANSPRAVIKSFSPHH